ncbi:MAG: hypothetical protein F6K19_46285 [Cyanothece sp. SIO1E1]|nr:hypothetical protein [Cyanothece sp. SIO1E1]
MIPTKITFRLNNDESKQLYYAARDTGISAHQLARNIVIEGLSLSKIEEKIILLAERLEELKEAQDSMKQDLHSTQFGLIDALGILIAKQEGLNEDDVTEWLKKRFKTNQIH